MLKIKIEALSFELEIEIKENVDHYNLIVVRSKTNKPNDKGDIWHRQIKDLERVEELERLIMEAHKKPAVSVRITINDGIAVSFSFSINGKVGKFQVMDFVDDSNESIFMEKLFLLMHELIDEPVFKEYYSEWFK